MTTLLDGVNAVLKRVNIIKGENQSLVNLTSSSIQHEIDVCIQVWNEALTELYSGNETPHPQESKEANITLVQGQREYTLPNDLVTIRYPLMEDVSGYYIFEYTEGFEHLRKWQQIPDNYEGRPNYATINPKNNKLYMDYIPTSAEDGLVYRLLYDGSVLLAASTDVFPFNDSVYTMMIPAVAELWKLDQRKTFNDAVYKKRLAQAASLLMQRTPNTGYWPR